MFLITHALFKSREDDRKEIYAKLDLDFSFLDFKFGTREGVSNQVFIIQKEYYQTTRIIITSFILNTYSFPYFQNSCCQLRSIVSAKSEFHQFCMHSLLVQNKRTQEHKKQINTKNRRKTITPGKCYNSNNNKLPKTW